MKMKSQFAKKQSTLWNKTGLVSGVLGARKSGGMTKDWAVVPVPGFSFEIRFDTFGLHNELYEP